MSVSDITRCSEQILKAKSSRNRAVERLGFDVKHNPWDVLDVPNTGAEGESE